jgi:hypothetical protein
MRDAGGDQRVIQVRLEVAVEGKARRRSDRVARRPLPQTRRGEQEGGEEEGALVDQNAFRT